jgi:hypothetical protein
MSCFSIVIPAKAGIQLPFAYSTNWTPAFAGVTQKGFVVLGSGLDA